jgi:hypothetical protein
MGCLSLLQDVITDAAPRTVAIADIFCFRRLTFCLRRVLRADYLVGHISNLPVAVDSHNELLYKKSLSMLRLKLTRTGARSDS